MKYKTRGYKIFNCFNIVFMVLLGIMLVFPYLNILARSFNDAADSARGGLTIFPRVFSVENYKTLFADKSIPQAAVVSVLRVVISVVLSIIVQFAAAYALTFKFEGKKFFNWLFTIPMFLTAGMVPTYVLITKLGLLNNFWVYILPGLFSFYNTIIIRTFIGNTIPKALQESAMIDGADEIKILFKIIIPLSMPVLATVALWIMVGQWNDWTTTLYYIRKSSLFTLQYIMMQMVKESERIQQMIQAARESGQTVDENFKTASSDGLIAAQVIITTIPIICVYPFLQKYFVKGIMMGGVKE